jgi:hypothetical protein
MLWTLWMLLSVMLNVIHQQQMIFKYIHQLIFIFDQDFRPSMTVDDINFIQEGRSSSMMTDSTVCYWG